MKMLLLGAGNMVSCDRIVCIVSPDTAPVKRLVQDAKEEGRVIDVSGGKKTKSVIITDSDHVILSKIVPQKLRDAIANDTDVEEDEDE
ncbi:MAG: DUF370 domain-containing protein [Clostridia bacterium]|nr:DUF370 domain-containing protein [Clostridia bacterium]